MMLREISNWSVAAALLIGLLQIKKLGRDSYIMLGLIACACVPQLLNELDHDNPAKGFVYNVYTAAEFVCVCLLFKNKYRLRYFRPVTGISAGMYVIASAWLIGVNGLSEFISGWVCLNNVFFAFWTLLYLMEIVIDDEIRLDPVFAIYSITILLYSCISILYFGFEEYIHQHPDSVLHHLESLHDLSNIPMYISFAVGLYKDAQRK